MELIPKLFLGEESLTRQELLISPFLGKLNLTNPRDHRHFQELNQAATFLNLFSHKWKIIKMREEPDFIISDGDSLVGLEHTSLLDNKLRSREGSIEDLFLRAENVLRLECIDHRFLANAYIHTNYIPKKNRIDSDIKEICSVIRNFVINNKLFDSNIIKRISISPHDKISLHANLGAWWQAPLTDEKIIIAIERKEKLLHKYKINTNLEQWLLLVAGHVGEGSYAIFDRFDLHIKSSFKKIFLLEVSPSKLFELK